MQSYCRSGRWRSDYTIDFTSKQIIGKILVNVHYYEQGNVCDTISTRFASLNPIQVQLETKHNSSIAFPPGISASNPPQQTADTILALIEAEEGKYQASLNNSYQDMAEKTFKSLRRALPMTRQKLDWDRVRLRFTFTLVVLTHRATIRFLDTSLELNSRRVVMLSLPGHRDCRCTLLP